MGANNRWTHLTHQRGSSSPFFEERKSEGIFIQSRACINPAVLRWTVGWTPKLLKLDEASGTPRPYINDEGQVYPKDDKDTFFVTGRRSVKSGPLTELALKKAAFGTPMSYKNATSEKRMGSFAYIRRDITRRVKVALGLIMTRGAYVDTDQTSSSKVRIQFNDEDVGRKWSMQGSWNLYIDLRLHTYHCLQVGPIYSTYHRSVQHAIPPTHPKASPAPRIPQFAGGPLGELLGGQFFTERERSITRQP